MSICLSHRYLSRTARMLLAGASVVAFTASTPKAFAQIEITSEVVEANNKETEFTKYYTIDEGTNKLVQNETSVDVLEITSLSFTELVSKARSVALSLLRWKLHPQPLRAPIVKYNRKLHFGRWINDPTDETCYNTRAKVLIRDSEKPVSFREHNHCLVEKGAWLDPYTGLTMTESSQIQIDHMVPLKNAYVSGAWQWNFQTRCTYANFMGNKFHLISASGHENMSKGDSSPDSYLPPNESYRCQYLENWLKVKLIWNLKMVPSEVESIRQSVKENGCDPSRFTLTTAELRRQRQIIYDNPDFCPDR